MNWENLKTLWTISLKNCNQFKRKKGLENALVFFYKSHISDAAILVFLQLIKI